MLNYRTKIFLNTNANNDVEIKTDMGAHWYTVEHHNNEKLTIGSWWEKQAQIEIRSWQKDICIQMGADAMGMPVPYIIYKKGGGFSQPHDMCLAYYPSAGHYIFSTHRHFWIQQKNKSKETVLDIKDSIGCILNAEHRSKIYSVIDEFKDRYNSRNICLTLN